MKTIQYLVANFAGIKINSGIWIHRDKSDRFSSSFCESTGNVLENFQFLSSIRVTFWATVKNPREIVASFLFNIAWYLSYSTFPIYNVELAIISHFSDTGKVSPARKLYNEYPIRNRCISSQCLFSKVASGLS